MDLTNDELGRLLGADRRLRRDGAGAETNAGRRAV